MGNTTELRRELKRRFYPFAAEHGFQIDTANGPFGIEFRRLTPDGVEVFDLQWEKSGRPRFVVNFGHCPAGGVIHAGEQVLPDKVLSYMGSSSGRLQPGKGSGTGCWFRQDRSFFRRVMLRQQPRAAAEVVDELLGLFQELQAWFRDRHVGPHIVMMHFPWQQQRDTEGQV